jgi:ABC-type multidrug transport system fused ATPase/permease subunit
MFKAKLIENEQYYKLRSKQFILMLLPALPIGIIANFYQIQIWITLILIAVYVLMILLMSRNQKRLNSLLGVNLIEIDENEIRVKSKNGHQKERIQLENVEKIILKDDYSIPQETIKDMSKEMKGETKKNFLIIQGENNERKFDFEFDSYYMLEELKKIIKSWEVKGFNIERSVKE